MKATDTIPIVFVSPSKISLLSRLEWCASISTPTSTTGIDKGQVPAEEVEALQAALTRGEIVAHLSLADIEELLGQWDTARRAGAIRRLRVARGLDTVGLLGDG